MANDHDPGDEHEPEQKRPHVDIESNLYDVDWEHADQYRRHRDPRYSTERPTLQCRRVAGNQVGDRHTTRSEVGGNLAELSTRDEEPLWLRESERSVVKSCDNERGIRAVTPMIRLLSRMDQSVRRALRH